MTAEYRIAKMFGIHVVIASFNLSESESARLRKVLDDCRAEALHEALDWLDSESKAVCLTRDAARKSWGIG